MARDLVINYLSNEQILRPHVRHSVCSLISHKTLHNRPMQIIIIGMASELTEIMVTRFLESPQPIRISKDHKSPKFVLCLWHFCGLLKYERV